MKVLFIARHFTYFRNFDSAIALLAQRGHAVHLAADRDEQQGGRELVDRLAREHEGVTTGVTPIREVGRYTRLSRALRLGLDYLRYSDPRYESMPKIRQRAYDRTPAFILWLARLPFRQALTWMLERVEAAVPRDRRIDAFIAGHAPDIVLITPLIELGSPQLDYVRAARRAGVPTALCVWSWDHLSSKALIREVPDSVIVWNDVQKDEAARFHGIDSERVRVTGAQCFDRWFDRGPSRRRTDFCRLAGLPNDRPFILYVCSALFRGSPSEAEFVKRWVAAVRSSPDPALHDVNILVRPHPQRMEEWTNTTLEGAALWGSNPMDPGSRDDYFDSLYYSAAVVGLNTSALVEAAIVDRPVYTILMPEFGDNQEGTFHFHHLLTVGGGFLRTARDLAGHVEQLAAQFIGGAVPSNRPFVERFIRPRGLAVAASPVFVDEVEKAARSRPASVRQRLAAVWLLRPVVYALVLAGRLPFLERLYWNPAKFRMEQVRLPATLLRQDKPDTTLS